MKREETDKLNREEKIDPVANPLTSFGRDDDLTDELIKGLCQKTEVESPTSKESIISSGLKKQIEKMDEYVALKKNRKTICIQ